ncbi:MAG TPA: zinc-binding dehydrogenase [Thermoleophilaceae bacterium]|jgi:NADPH:quinone reductase-like Zn-dependent oxidoreductase
MRAVVITENGEPDVLQVRDWPEPELGEGQVRVDVAAAGVNFADVMARIGLYPDAPEPPCVVGYEVAGTIAEVGPGVDGGLEPGQKIFSGTRFGGYAERVVIPAGHAVPLPEGMSFEEATAIPVNYATAWSGLIRFGNLWAGERVLIHAAAGGVGIAATHIAKITGAEIWGTASPAKHDAIRGFGVDHAIDYRQEGWEEGLPQFDLILDGVGGRSFQTSYDLLGPGGRLVAIGSSAVVSGDTKMPRFSVMKQMFQSKSVIGVNVLRLWDSWGSGEMPWVDPLSQLLDSGALKPVIAEAFPFDRAPDAHRMLAERRNIGKVVLLP